ncbi:adenylate kinase [Desulfurococcaceae archaeon AG1]|nr:adenylate kinase [Desulfurococcaceae archaeon AG1]
MLRHPFPVAIVVGVPGVGKSTVVDLSVKILSGRGLRTVVLNYGDYMFKRLSLVGVVRSRDEIRGLPIRIQVENQAEAARMMIRSASEELQGSKGLLIVDTHLLIRTPSGYWPGLPLHVAQELKPDAIILIEASPEEILSRQARDKTRVRKDYADPAIIEEMMRMNRIEALVVASFTGATVNIVYNREGEAEKAARELASILENLIIEKMHHI